MVGDAVEQGAGEALAGEDGGPFLEGQVRGDDCGAVFVAPAEDVERDIRLPDGTPIATAGARVNPLAHHALVWTPPGTQGQIWV